MSSPAWLTARPIAHRGLHDRAAGVIENTPAAFAAAVSGGYAMECDVQLTADGEAVVFHDFGLERLTGRPGLVRELSATTLGEIGISDCVAGNRIGTLQDLVALVAGRAPIVVEIKSRFDGDLRLTRRVVEILADAPPNIAIKSFDPRVVSALRMMAPGRPRGIVAMARYDYPDYDTIPPDEKIAMANLLHFSEMQPDFISWHVKDLPHCAPYLCRSQLGLPVMTWTVRTPADVAAARRHADQMVFEGFLPDA